MFVPENTHSSWDGFLTKSRLMEIDKIEEEVGTEFNPTEPSKVLRFLTLDLYNVQVIWLGQDVYPAEGVATGRAFEVGTLTSWNEPFRQASLKNIIRLIYKNYFKIKSYDDILTYSKIKPQIMNGTFPILEPKQWFNNLEKQGVLFLNTAFTCEIGKPNSHKHLWENFSKEVIQYISSIRPDVKWFLWGREAQANKPFILKGQILESRHPSRVQKKPEDDFLKFDGFAKTFDKINWLGNNS